MIKVIVFDQCKGKREDIDVFVGNTADEVEVELRKVFPNESKMVPAHEIWAIINNIKAVFGKYVEVWMKVE